MTRAVLGARGQNGYITSTVLEVPKAGMKSEMDGGHNFLLLQMRAIFFLRQTQIKKTACCEIISSIVTTNTKKKSKYREFFAVNVSRKKSDMK